MYKSFDSALQDFISDQVYWVPLRTNLTTVAFKELLHYYSHKTQPLKVA